MNWKRINVEIGSRLGEPIRSVMKMFKYPDGEKRFKLGYRSFKILAQYQDDNHDIIGYDVYEHVEEKNETSIVPAQ